MVSGNAMLYLSSALAIVMVITFSFYMVRNTKGKMSEGFKIMLLGHIPMLLLRVAEFALIWYGDYSVSDLKLSFLEQTTQIIAALSVFIAIYIIRNMAFVKQTRHA